MPQPSILVSAVATALVFSLAGCGSGNDGEYGVVAPFDDILDIFGGGEVNGCTVADALDMSGETAVTITNVTAWTVPHSACIIVDAGTAVTWQGNFEIHPLVGGASPTRESGSSITEAGSNGTEDTTVTFSLLGRFPYFCEVHDSTMLGVVYVLPERSTRPVQY